MFLFSAALIVLMPKTHAQPRQRPLCVSQFSLVSYACASLPYAPVPGSNPIPTPPSPDDDGLADDDSGAEVGSDDKHQNIQDERHEARHGGQHEQRHNGNSHGRQQGHRDRHEGHGRHERGHGDSHRDGDGNEHDDDDGDHHDRRHGHRHGHRHKHRHRWQPIFPVPPTFGSQHPKYESPAVENCCRWLKELDDECVCDLLTHLPPFLSKPSHDYSISVGQSCEITYHCW